MYKESLTKSGFNDDMIYIFQKETRPAKEK